MAPKMPNFDPKLPYLAISGSSCLKWVEHWLNSHACMIIVMDNYCYKIHTLHFCSLPTNVDGDDIKSMAVIESEMAIKSGPKIKGNTVNIFVCLSDAKSYS